MLAMDDLNWKLENSISNSIKNKYLQINFKNELQDLYTKIYKTLVIEIKGHPDK